MSNSRRREGGKMRRVQTFVVTIETPYKDSCGMHTHELTAGDIRRALESACSESAEVSVDERGSTVTGE